MTTSTAACDAARADDSVDAGPAPNAERRENPRAPDREIAPTHASRGGRPGDLAAPRGLARLAVRLGAAIQSLLRIIGAPDYEAYVAHLRSAHPGQEPMSRDEFVRERMENRYSRPGSRCC